MKMVFLIFLLFSSALKAKSLYEDFHSLGFFALTNNGVPHLGIDQVHFKTEKEFVLVKTGLRGSFQLNSLVETPKGVMIYRKDGENTALFYFRGMNTERVRLILRKLDRSVTYLPFTLPTAHANDCQEVLGAPILGIERDLKQISAFASWELLKRCLSGLGDGAYDSTIGVVKSVAREASAFAKDPIQYMETAGDQIEDFLFKTGGIIKGLVTQPDKTLRDMGRGLGESWEKISQSVRDMSPEMKVSFVCQLVGALGIDAALVFISSGTITPKILISINNLAHKFTLSSKLLSLLSKEKSRILPEKREKFMQGLFLNKIPDEDIKHLDELSHLGEEMSLRTLSCYIQ